MATLNATGNLTGATVLAAAFADASAIAAPGSFPLVILDSSTGFPVVRFTASQSTTLTVPSSALDLSSATASFAIFLVARIWGGTYDNDNWCARG